MGNLEAKAFGSVRGEGKLSVKTLATGNEDCRLLGGVIGSLLLYKQRIRGRTGTPPQRKRRS